jgi:hypothetical protein
MMAINYIFKNFNYIFDTRYLFDSILGKDGGL